MYVKSWSWFTNRTSGVLTGTHRPSVWRTWLTELTIKQHLNPSVNEDFTLYLVIWSSLFVFTFLREFSLLLVSGVTPRSDSQSPCFPDVLMQITRRPFHREPFPTYRLNSIRLDFILGFIKYNYSRFLYFFETRVVIRNLILSTVWCSLLFG